MIPENETFDGTFPFAPHFSTAPGFRMHYVDEGPPGAAETLLLLHGEPTWGYLFREIIPTLARTHRVVVPDYMGFGKSDTPPDRAYTASAHVNNLERLVLDLDLRDLTLVLHDWGGAIGGGLAGRHPGRVRRLAVTNSLLSLGHPAEAAVARCFEEADYFRWMRRLHAAGHLETVLGEFGTIVLAVMRGLQGFERSEQVTDAWLRAYGRPFATPAECRGAIAFPQSVVTNTIGLPVPDAATAALLRAKPALAIFGMRDKVLLPEYFVPCFEASFPDAPVHRLAGAGHFLYEDEPAQIARLLEEFVARTGPDATPEMKNTCERCAVRLPTASAAAMVCSYGCTFCAPCAAGPLAGRCPNCGGELRPRRARVDAPPVPPSSPIHPPAR